MASAWGVSWGRYWGNAWGALSSAVKPSGVRGSGKKKRLVVVEFDGDKFKVEEENLPSLLQEIEQKAEVQVTENKKPQVKIVSAPKEVRLSIKQEVDRTNEILAMIYRKVMEMEDEENVILLMAY
jgi:hypothetical protein